MKTAILERLFSFFGVFLFLFSLNAQSDVYLKINHKWNGTSFIGRPVVSQNSSAAPFILSRMEYYISGIEIIHDSGRVTPVSGKYLLVDANDTCFKYLGNFDLTNIEGISFHIGVDSLANHSDPSLYEGSHPLKLKFPSMHWGWEGGYMFVVFNGGTGPGMNFLSSVMALGDNNYHKQTQTVSANNFGGDLIINLDAEYANALNSLVVDQNLNYHGDLYEAKTLIENFRDYVFSGSTVGFAGDRVQNDPFSLYPNPTNGIVKVLAPEQVDLSYEVRELNGKLIKRGALQNKKEIDLTDHDSGIYLIQFFDGKRLVKSDKLFLH